VQWIAEVVRLWLPLPGTGRESITSWMITGNDYSNLYNPGANQLNELINQLRLTNLLEIITLLDLF
jgi:hypothetical protein